MEKRVKVFKKYFKKKRGALNAEVHDVIAEDLNSVYVRATSLIGEDTQTLGNPISIRVPDAFFANGKVQFRIDTTGAKEQTVQKLVYNQSLVTTLYFAQGKLYYHQVNIDHSTGRFGYDVAGELFLDSISHIKTEFSYDDLRRPRIIKLELVISLVDGTVVPFTLRAHHVYNGYPIDHVLTEEETNLLTVIKNQLRV